jgi:hypothetical protein
MGFQMSLLVKSLLKIFTGNSSLFLANFIIGTPFKNRVTLNVKLYCLDNIEFDQ